MKALDLIAAFGAAPNEDGPGYRALCPVHGDHSPSLLVKFNADTRKLVLLCESRQCPYVDLMKAAGLTARDGFDVEGLDEVDADAGKPTKAPAPANVRVNAGIGAYRAAVALANALRDGTDPDLGRTLAERFGIDPAEVTATAAEALGIGYDPDSRRLTVTARTAAGDVAFVQGRALDPDARVRWEGLPNPEGGRWDGVGFVGRVTGDRPVVVTEGPSDGLTVAALGLYDVIGIRGATNGARVSEAASALTGRDVFLCADGDQAGDKMNEDAARVLRPVAASVRVVPMPRGKDLGDVRADDPEKFPAVLAQLLGEAEEASDDEPETDDDFDSANMGDAHLGARVAAEFLRGRFVAWGKSAWSRWDGRRWDRATETTVLETVRRALLDIHARETEAANRRLERQLDEVRARDFEDESDRKSAAMEANARHARRLKALGALFNVGKIAAVMRIARGLVEIKQEVFDLQPDLLNVGNGVVDLRTGELRPHDPALYFTKITEVNYRPGAEHADWSQALTALPPAVAEWMRVRFGQTATGYATQDDIVPFLKGGGSNGKSTVLVGVSKALGDFAVVVPEKVLLASPSDHPTEQMTLLGARLAYIEELPEGDYLNAQRLKKAAGTDTMKARFIGQDNVEWSATHSLFVTTNYDVQVDAVDWGTWRRLALVVFPYTFDGTDPDHAPDPTLRLRMLEPGTRHEAALAWIVEGARRWYEAGKVIPPMPTEVREATATWRYEANHAARFMDEFLEPDVDSAVRSGDVYRLFSDWASSHGIRRWGDRLFWQRARQHEWFRNGTAEKAEGSVRTNGWKIQQHPLSAPVKTMDRLVTGVRFTPDAAERLPY